MDEIKRIEHDWPFLLRYLPGREEIEALAKKLGALKRKRAIKDGEDLLRVALVYGFAGKSLRQTASWAEEHGIGKFSNVSLIKRLRNCEPLLGQLLGLKLAERGAPAPRNTSGIASVSLIDATTVCGPRATKAEWRVHLRYNPATLMIEDAQLTSYKTGESLDHFRFAPRELAVADAGYARRKGLQSAADQDAYFIVRTGWRHVPLISGDGGKIDLLRTMEQLPPAGAGEWQARISPDAKQKVTALPVRLIGVRRTPAAVERALKRIRRRSSKTMTKTDDRTLEAAKYVFLLTNAPAELLPAEEALEFYRFRWQVEIAIKRLKSILELSRLPAEEEKLSRFIIYCKLLGALLLDDLTQHWLGFSPWGYPETVRIPVAVAGPGGHRGEDA